MKQKLEVLLTAYETQKMSRENYLWALEVEIALAGARIADEKLKSPF